MEANSWHHKLFYFHLFFESGKYKIEGEKLQKIVELKSVPYEEEIIHS